MTPRTVRALLAALVLLPFAACAATTRVVQPLAGEPPATIAVLPFAGTLAPRARGIVRQLVGSFLQDRRYARLDDEHVDARLALAGLRPWEPSWLPPDEELAAFGRTLGVDALVIGDGFAESGFFAGVYFERGLVGRIRLLDVATAKTTWSADAATSKSGGVLLNSGQVIRALSDTVESGSEVVFARLAAGLALDAAAALPENPRPMGVMVRPSLTSATLLGSSASGAVLTSNEFIDVEARGTAGGRARVSIAARAGEHPLAEVEPGVYRGRIRIEAGSGDAEGPVAVTVFDAFGGSSMSLDAGRVRVAAGRLDPPATVTADVIDHGSRRVRLRWQATPGCVGYSIVRISESGSATLDGGTRLEYEDVVPGGTMSVTYIVAARSPGGAFGPPSSAVRVTLGS